MFHMARKTTGGKEPMRTTAAVQATNVDKVEEGEGGEGTAAMMTSDMRRARTVWDALRNQTTPKKRARRSARDDSDDDDDDDDDEDEEGEEEEDEDEEDETMRPLKKKQRRQQQQEVADMEREISFLKRASVMRATGAYTDLCFLCSDGRRVLAHRLVLDAVLPPESHLRGLVCMQQPQQPSRSMESSSLSDMSELNDATEVNCSGRMMEAILDFIYENRLAMSAAASSAVAEATEPGPMMSSSSSSSSSALNVESRDHLIAIHPDEVWRLVHHAQAFGVPGLAERVREEMRRELIEEVRVEKAVAYLYHLHLQEQRQTEARDLLAFVVDLIAHNLEHFAPTFYFNVLPFQLFRRIIHHPELAVRKEVVVWEVVRKYCATVQPPVSPSQMADLVSAVRFGYMTAEELHGASISGLVGEELMREGFYHSLQRKESRGKWNRQVKQILQQPVALRSPSSIRSLPRPKPGKLVKSLAAGRSTTSVTCSEGKVFRYKNKDFGQDGIVWWLGSNRGKDKVYSNPNTTKIINLTPSSYHSGYPLDAALGGYPSLANGRGSRRDFLTNSAAGSWLIMDFGAKYRRLRIIPTHITIKSGNGGNYSLCNFNFEATNRNPTRNPSAANWKTLLTVSNDMSLQSGGNKTWRIPKKSEDEEDEDEDEDEAEDDENGYRYFRILCTGPDTSGSEYLGLGGFEIYGTVLFVE